MWQKLKNLFRKKETRPEIKLTNTIIEQRIDLIIEINLGFYKELTQFNSKLKFWQSVFKALAFVESDFNPNETYFEETMGYYSRGLFQLSYEDCRSYNFFLDKNKDEIYDIALNTQFAMVIMNRQIKNHGNFIFNSGNYWSTLKPLNKRYDLYQEKFKEYLK